jgi:ribose-phosphate pyrophosphokinase
MRNFVIPTTGYVGFAESLANVHADASGFLRGRNFDVQMCEIERKVFADGEKYHRYVDDVRGARAVIVGSTSTDEEFMELYDLAWHACKAGAADIRICIPYFGYSTMERAVKPGEIVKAKVRAQMLSSLPCTQRITIVLVDLHASGMEHYFEGSVHTVHHYAKYPILSRIRSVGAHVIASTDAGRAKWVESLANEIGLSSAFITKRRLSGSETEVAAVNADVSGKVVAIYDDMCRTGSSLVKAARVYRQMGAKEVHAVFTHPVLPGDSLGNLINHARENENLPLFDSISYCNTLGREIPEWAPNNFVHVLDVADSSLAEKLFE